MQFVPAGLHILIKQQADLPSAGIKHNHFYMPGPNNLNGDGGPFPERVWKILEATGNSSGS
jgi:hypothetical protein